MKNQIHGTQHSERKTTIQLDEQTLELFREFKYCGSKFSKYGIIGNDITDRIEFTGKRLKGIKRLFLLNKEIP